MADMTAIAAFVQTAQDRSFTRAARRLGMGQSAVSKAVARLEEDLAVKLLNRSTRSVTLTAEGLLFHERCRRILADLEEAREEVTSSLALARGTLRITCPLSLGELVLAPRLSAFTSAHPTLHIECSFTNRWPEFIEDRIDAALWMSALPDTTAIARPLGAAAIVTCAAPHYLEVHGMPNHPAALENHAMLSHVVQRTGLPRPWQFTVDGAAIMLQPGYRVLSDNSQLLLELACAGEGIVQTPLYVAAQKIEAGKLVPILRRFAPPGSPTCIVYPHRQLPRRVRVLIDFLLPLFRAPLFGPA